MGSKHQDFVAGCREGPGGDSLDEQKERDLDDSSPVTETGLHSKPRPLAVGDSEGYCAEDSSLDDEDLKDSPHVAEIKHSNPKPRFKGKYNILSRLFLL